VTRTQRWTLAVVCAATAMLMLDIAVVNTALSAIAADLDTGLTGLQWIVDAYTLPLAATVITMGALADRFGGRRLFTIGLALFTATSMLCAAAQSITALNVARAAQGIGAAVMFAVSLAVLSHAFPRMDQRMKALAAYGATMGGSFAVGPLVGGARALVDTGDHLGHVVAQCREVLARDLVADHVGDQRPNERVRLDLRAVDHRAQRRARDAGHRRRRRHVRGVARRALP